MPGNKKKVGLFLSAHPHAGGAYQYSLSVLDAFLAFPGEKVIAFSEPSWRTLIPRTVKSFFVTVPFTYRAMHRTWRVMGGGPGFLRPIFSLVHPVARQLRRERCDLWIFPAEDAWAFLINVPAVVGVFDLMHRYEKRFPEVSARGEFERREYHFRNLGRFARGVLVDSRVGAKQMHESFGVKPDRLHVLPFVRPKYMDYTGTENNLDLPEKFFYYPAQFWSHKNHMRLVEALALLPSDANVQFVFTGAPKNEFENVRKRVKALKLDKQVHFLGYIGNQDVSEIYRRARALVMPTFFGPTNIPPLEAFAAGCPVAVSDVYGMREQLGDAAYYFNPASVEEIREVLRKLWFDDDLCRGLIAKGREHALRWGPPQFGARLHQIITSI